MMVGCYHWQPRLARRDALLDTRHCSAQHAAFQSSPSDREGSFMAQDGNADLRVFLTRGTVL